MSDSAARPNVVLSFALCAAGCSTFQSDVARPPIDPLFPMLESPLIADIEPVPHAGTVPDETFGEPPAPPPRIAGDELGTVRLRGVALAEAIHAIAELANVNIYLDAGLDAQVDAVFPSVKLDDALQAILKQNGLGLVEDPPGIFWVRKEDGTQPGMGRFQLRSIRAADVKDQITEIAGGGTVVVIDENQNLVLVRGEERDVRAVAEFLDAVDRVKRQVLVEVNIFEVNIDERFELGFAHELQGSSNGDTLNLMQALTGPDDAFSLVLNSEGGNIMSTLQAMRRYVGLELISSPRVLAVTGTEAVIEVLEEVPYVNSTTQTTTDGGLSTSTIQQIEFKETGIKLKVLPTIQAGGVLHIEIDTTLSEVVDFFLGVPVVDSRHLSSGFLVNDRQTIVLGGLMQDRRSERDSGVPVLMHIPLIGGLFRGNEDATEKRELLVFLTPRILDPSQAAGLAGVFKDHYREKRRRMGVDVPAIQEAK